MKLCFGNLKPWLAKPPRTVTERTSVFFLAYEKQFKYIHTYIHNWPLQLFGQDYGLASHTTHVVCVNFLREWWDLQFNVDSERQIFEKLSHGRFI